MTALRLSLLVFLLSANVSPLPATAQANLLANGELDSFDETGLAVGWSRWWEEAPKPDDGSLNYAYKPDWWSETNPALVQSGTGSQHIGTSWNPWHAGIFQRLNVPPGARLRITAYGRVFASTPDFPNPSDTAVQSRMQIGADPNGGTDWWAGSVQWSGLGNPHDTWQQFSTEVTTGPNGKVTIFLSANYRGDSRLHLDAWWDNVSAVVVDVAPTPIPTSPAAPTSAASAPTRPPTQPAPTLPAATAAPVIDSSPTATNPPAATPVASAGGALCVSLFEDANGNGTQDGGERLIAGGQIQVVAANATAATYTTDGVNEPHCLTDLPAGAYSASVAAPAGYSPTTGNKVTLIVQPGEQANAAFGAQSNRISPTEAPAAAPQDESPGLFTAFVIAAGAFLVVMLGVAGFVWWQRR